MLRRVLIFSFICLIFSGITSCDRSDKPKPIDTKKSETRDKPKVIDTKKWGTNEDKINSHETEPIRIAVGGMITPREGFAYYKKLLDYVGEKLGEEVEFVDKEDYAEINELLKTKYIDVAFVCGGPYVDGHKDFGMELLVAPKAYGGTVYYSYIIAHKDSPVNSLEDLRGKSFAFTDPLSNTGKLVPTYMLAKMNESPESFFSQFDFTYAHDLSIKTVATEIIDGAAVDSLIWEYSNRVNPEFTSRTKIIKKSPPYGIPPVVVHPALDPKLKESLKQIFLTVHEDKKGQEILKGMLIEKFVPIADSDYNSIREMKLWISKQKEDTQ